MQKLRYLPPVCLLIALFRILTGRLRYSYEYVNQTVQAEDGNEYSIFRQISSHTEISSEHSCVFIVRFKFKHLSHKANKIASKIPMLLIAGHPGFISKCYAVNRKNGYWQGMYEWKSIQDLETYKKSFVFRMMNKRVISSTVQFKTMINQTLRQCIDKNIKHMENIYWTDFPIMII
jgi:hypothetical protein